MAEQDVARFFESVYNDRSLQGSLHDALVQAAPDVVVEIARKKGYQISADDLSAAMGQGEELSEAELDKVAGGASLSSSQRISSASLSRNFWGGFAGKLGGGGLAASGFGLTIPGPSFVLVNSAEARATDEGPASGPVSARELFDSLDD